MNNTDLTETELIIIEYMAQCRDLIMEGEAVLERIRANLPCKTTARRIFDGVRPFVEQARMFATTAEYAGCHESLEQLADDLEALREAARALIR